MQEQKLAHECLACMILNARALFSIGDQLLEQCVRLSAVGDITDGLSDFAPLEVAAESERSEDVSGAIREYADQLGSCLKSFARVSALRMFR